MSKVLITRSKLDGLATTIAAKSGATLPLTIAQMDAAVASIVTRDSPYDYLGQEPEFVKNLYSAQYLLKDTLYNGWTPSTTAKAIVASVTLQDTYSADMATYEYYLR